MSDSVAGVCFMDPVMDLGAIRERFEAAEKSLHVAEESIRARIASSDDVPALLSEVTRLEKALEEIADISNRRGLELAAAQQRVDDAESLLAGLSDCLNQELRENGPVDVAQTLGYLEDMRPFVRLLVDLVRERSDRAAQQREERLKTLIRRVLAYGMQEEADNLLNEALEEKAGLEKELRCQWESNHAEHCRNEWPHEGMCRWPLPEALGFVRPRG